VDASRTPLSDADAERAQGAAGRSGGAEEATPEPPSGAPRGSPVASPIVVGVSPVTGSRSALQWAVEEARVRNAGVRAVMAWRGSGLPGGAPGRFPAESITGARQDQRGAEQTLAEFVQDALGEEHGVELVAVEGKAGDVLLREAEDAALLVVDSPAMARMYEPRARRLAPHLIYRSACPVVVMPPAEPEADLEDFWGEEARAAEGAPAGEGPPAGEQRVAQPSGTGT
jgi:nucleotide-binding universal stress UspA family protein